MAARTTTSTIPPALRVTNDLNVALTTWSTSQRTVIGLAADFAKSGEWTATGAVSAARWIAGVADIEVCTAREWIRVGRRLWSLPLIAELFEADELSYSKVRTLSRVATPENEQQLAAIAADVPAGALPRAIAAWLHRTSNDAELERDRACVDCGATTLLEYDHVPDFSQTGHTVVEELELRCAPCHQRRHDREAAA